MSKELYLTGIVYMLLSATGLAFAGLLGKLGFSSFSLPSLIFFRFSAAFLICLTWMGMTGKLKEGLPFSNFKLNLLRAFFVLSAQYSFYYFLERNSLLNGVALLNTGPLFIPIIERGILGHRVEKAEWLGVAIAFLGVLCILQPNAGIFSIVSFIGLFAGLCQGASQVVFGLNSKRERSDLGLLFLFFLCAGFSLFPYLFSGPTLDAGVSFSTSLIWLVAGLGIASVCNQFFRAHAYKHGTPSKLAAFLYFSVVLAGIFDWAIFDIIPNALSIFGAALVMAGGLIKIYFHLRRIS